MARVVPGPRAPQKEQSQLPSCLGPCVQQHPPASGAVLGLRLRLTFFFRENGFKFNCCLKEKGWGGAAGEEELEQKGEKQRPDQWFQFKEAAVKWLEDRVICLLKMWQ